MMNKSNPLNWELIQEYEESGIAVRIMKAGYRWSMQIGRIKEGADYLVPYLPLRVAGGNSLTQPMTAEVDVADIVGRLVERAQAYILVREEEFRSERLAKLIERDEQFVDKTKKFVKVTGKTARVKENKLAARK